MVKGADSWVRSNDCKGRSTWLTSFSYSSKHSLTPCALWMGPQASWDRQVPSASSPLLSGLR